MKEILKCVLNLESVANKINGINGIKLHNIVQMCLLLVPGDCRKTCSFQFQMQPLYVQMWDDCGISTTSGSNKGQNR